MSRPAFHHRNPNPDAASFVAERGNNDFARRVAITMERVYGASGFDRDLPASFNFRGGGPDPRIGVASPVVVRRKAVA